VIQEKTMAINITLGARNHNVLRYRVQQDGTAGTTGTLTFTTMRSDLAFEGSPLDVILQNAITETSNEVLTQSILGVGQSATPLEPETMHAVTSVLRNNSPADNQLGVTTLLNQPLSENELQFGTVNTNTTVWILEIRLDYTNIQ
jgi:hypothetical protein